MTIFIENFKIKGEHGYYKEEYYKTQTFVVSMWCDLIPDSKVINDDLNETFSYEVIRKVILKSISGEHKKLLETLCVDMINEILKYKIVQKVKVKITKPEVWNDCEPGVMMEEERQTSANKSFIQSKFD